MKQGHIHTESLRARPVEVSVSTTPKTRQGCHKRGVSPPTILSPFPEQVGSLISNLEAPLTMMCPQAKTEPCLRDWRAAGLLLLLTLVTAGAMAGGLLGFMYSPPKVSTTSSLGGYRVGSGLEGQYLSASNGAGSKHWP